MSSSPAVVRASHLSKRFRLYHERHQSLKQSMLNRKRSTHEDFWALRDVTFDVVCGETFGIVGHNGSGKSTLLKCLTTILQPDQGTVSVDGSISALLELGAGFHPELSGRENVFLNAAILGVPRRHIQERFDEIVEFSGLAEFIDTPVKNYSSGMFVRLGFAVAINVDPDVLIIDEVLAVGDAEFQAKCADKIAEFRESGRTIVLVTHSMGDVQRVCQRVAWLDHGRLRMMGAPHEITEAYLETSHDARAVQHQSGMRWGSGEVRIDGVDLLDGAEQPADFARTGDPLAIRVSLTASEQVDRIEVVLSIHDRNGVLVSEVGTRSRDLDVGAIEPGAARSLTFQIDELPLIEGTYELGCKVLDASSRELDVRSRMLRFDVLRGAVADDGLVALGGTWHL